MRKDRLFISWGFEKFVSGVMFKRKEKWMKEENFDLRYLIWKIRGGGNVYYYFVLR